MADVDGGMSDLEILSLNDGPPPGAPSEIPSSGSGESETSEAPQSPSAPVAESTQITEASGDDYAWAQPLLRDPNVAQSFKAAQERLKTYTDAFGSVADARQTLQQLESIGGVEGLRVAQARAQEVDRVDSIVYGGSEEEKRGYLEWMQKQNSEAFLRNVESGLQLIWRQNPKEFEYMMAPAVAERLEEMQIWPWLEHLAAEMERTPGMERALEALNNFAGIFSDKYGLGPGLPQATEAVAFRTAFNQEIGKATEETLQRGILESIAKMMPNADAQLQATILREAHLGLQAAIKGNKTLLHALKNLSRSTPTRKVGERAVSLLARSLWPLIPHVVRNLMEKNGLKENAAAPVKEKTGSRAERKQAKYGKADLRMLTDKAVMDMSAEDIATAQAEARPAQIPRDEARRMSFKALINDEREVARP